MQDQISLFDAPAVRSLLDRLITDSQLYRTTKEFKELLDFVVRQPHMAPFNAMLLQLQKPGLKFAMSAKQWRERFGRFPKEGTRPLLIMWPFGPVAFVYDELDTEGSELPIDVRSFAARGPIDELEIAKFKEIVRRKRIDWNEIDGGDSRAGSISLLKLSADPRISNTYRVNINKNHAPPTQFATLVHELGHLFLGHLGSDKKLQIKDRSELSHQQKELEAESVSYLVCDRCNVESRAHTYLHNYVQANDVMELVDVYAIMRAAGAVEALLELNPKAYKALDF